MAQKPLRPSAGLAAESTGTPVAPGAPQEGFWTVTGPLVCHSAPAGAMTNFLGWPASDEGGLSLHATTARESKR